MLLPGFHRRRRQLRSHFLFEINGDTIAYCYIRKNACSAFKRMILDRVGYTGKWEDGWSYLVSHHAAQSVGAVRDARWRIFVYRDPFERAVSLFRNKMIMQDRADDFLSNFERVAGTDPSDATFAEFVSSYLTRRSVDPHARSQSAHLLPVSYNVTSTLETLHDDMKPVVGEDLADRYFGTPANRSSAALFDDPSSDVPVRLLRERFAATGELPSTAAFNTPAIRSIVSRVYRRDYKLIR